jgi:hypothetical protein
VLCGGCKSHPATAPAASSRSSYGGDEIAEAFGMRVKSWCPSARSRSANPAPESAIPPPPAQAATTTRTARDGDRAAAAVVPVGSCRCRPGSGRAWRRCRRPDSAPTEPPGAIDQRADRARVFRICN